MDLSPLDEQELSSDALESTPATVGHSFPAAPADPGVCGFAARTQRWPLAGFLCALVPGVTALVMVVCFIVEPSLASDSDALMVFVGAVVSCSFLVCCAAGVTLP